MDKQQIIQFYLENSILLSPELLEHLDKPFPLNAKFSVLNKDALLIIENNIPINLIDYERAVVLKEKNHNKRLYEKFREYIMNNLKTKIEINPETKETIPEKGESTTVQALTENHLVEDVEEKSSESNFAENAEEIVKETKELSESQLAARKEKLLSEHRIKIVSDYNEKNKKRSVQDFVSMFNSRYKELEKILRSRQELQNLTSISRILSKKERENVALIGIVYDKQVSKKNNIILTLEDPTGTIKVVVNQSKEEMFSLAQEIQLDETIGVTGTFDGLIFANNILLPDIPLTKELKKSPEEGYFVVITDLQIGNKLFLEDEFKKFLQWLNGEAGSDQQKDIASKVKYLFLVGDLAEGVGIYPDQEYDLKIIDVYDQYKKVAEYLKEIKIPIIICPGNHDVGRLSEPQPGFHDEYSKAVWMLPNVLCVSNPSTINIFSSDTFEGFDVLMYHGGSFFYYFNNVPAIRQKGGPTRSDLVMKYLLQRRHLAPSHTSTVYIPDANKDPLVIDKVPDFFFSGHVHRSTVNNYRNVTCINASCWVAKTEEQERRGLEPQPGRAFIVNMQTREVKIMNFLSKEETEKQEEMEKKSDL
jgi:DNA polymerase II small subunit